jgi:hypothetical protein
MTAEEILSLKYHRGFLDFAAVFEQVCQRASGRREVVHTFARLFDDVRRLALDRPSHLLDRMRLTFRVQWTREKIETVGERLFALAELGQKRDAAWRDPPLRWIGGCSQEGGTTVTKVFVVHGRDHGVRDKIVLFLHEKGLHPVVMDRATMSGLSLLEKFEELAQQCAYSIVIATPDDHLTDRNTGKALKRLRQNVVPEIGYFWGRNGRRDKFSILLKPDPELDLPTDIQGLGYITITDDLGETQLKLQEELRHAGILPT